MNISNQSNVSQMLFVKHLLYWLVHLKEGEKRLQIVEKVLLLP